MRLTTTNVEGLVPSIPAPGRDNLAALRRVANRHEVDAEGGRSPDGCPKGRKELCEE